MKKIIFLLLLTSIAHAASFAIIKEVSEAIKNGNSKQLSSYFNSSIDLTVLDAEGMYSKIQAERIINDFFQKNQPTGFNILHQSNSKDGSQYAIGNLITSNGVFRTYFLIKKVNNQPLLQQIRFTINE